jgi:hypothetical protein
MQPGLQRFNFFINQLQVLLNKAKKQKNPALWLYSNNARTPLFMLEALAKLYSALHHKKRFDKLKAHFKLLEDAIGAIDYYDTVVKDFLKTKNIPKPVIVYLHAHTREKIEQLNELLTEKKWLDENNSRIAKIQQKLASVNWLDEAAELNAIQDFYGEEIYEIIEFIQQKNYHFDNMEMDVHELRRKLRWLSIYPQALQGAIQFTDNKQAQPHLKKYLTSQIIQSPYNRLPDAGSQQYFLMLHKKYFLSLSWMIAELGTIKDSGLHLIALKEALIQQTGASDAAAAKKASQLIGKKQPSLQILLDKAEAITKIYFEEHNLENLVSGVRKAT